MVDARIKRVRFALVAEGLVVLPFLALIALGVLYALQLGPWALVFKVGLVIFWGIYTILFVVLVLHLARIAPDEARERLLVRCVVGVSLAGMLIAPLSQFEVVHAALGAVVAGAAAIGGGVWLLWINYWLLRRSDLPRRHGRLGQFAGACTCIGVVLGWLAFLLPPMSAPQIILDGAEKVVLVLGGLASLVWLDFCSRWLRPAKPAAFKPSKSIFGRGGVLK